MSLFVVDIEADGPIPGKYSMVCFGAVMVDKDLDKTFYGETAPISDLYIPEALSISGITREEHLKFENPKEVMLRFGLWVKENSKGRAVFISDNLAFDWQWINWYFHMYIESNPFGFSGRRIGDLYSGMMKDIYKGQEWKEFRQTKHTHNPVDDALGNAQALLKMKEMGLKF